MAPAYGQGQILGIGILMQLLETKIMEEEKRNGDSHDWSMSYASWNLNGHVF